MVIKEPHTILLETLLLKVEGLEQAIGNLSLTPKAGHRLTWSHSKTDLIELIYALHSTAAFNNGKTTIKEVTGVFEAVFMVKLGNTSLRFQEILRRKDSTAYLDSLKKGLEMYMTRIDERR